MAFCNSNGPCPGCGMKVVLGSFEVSELSKIICDFGCQKSFEKRDGQWYEILCDEERTSNSAQPSIGG